MDKNRELETKIDKFNQQMQKVKGQFAEDMLELSVLKEYNKGLVKE